MLYEVITELQILKLMGKDSPISVKRLLTPEMIESIRAATESIEIDEMIEKYIVSIVTA